MKGRSIQSLTLRLYAGPVLWAVAIGIGVSLTGCASTQTAGGASEWVVGQWAYTLYDTPQGDLEGTLTIEQSEDRFAGEISSRLLNKTVPLDQVEVVGDEISFRVAFDVSGQIMELLARARRNGNTLAGNAEVTGFGSYPFQGIRNSN